MATDHAGDAAFAYLATFFAIWWAWMNFTWFASAYDVDDRSVNQWLRASRHGPSRPCARRYALGIALCQAGWISLLVFPNGLRRAGFVVFCAGLAVTVPVASTC